MVDLYATGRPRMFLVGGTAPAPNSLNSVFTAPILSAAGDCSCSSVTT